MTRAIESILESHPQGLQSHDIRRLVEGLLSKTIPAQTVNGLLDAGNAADGPFERLTQGRYRLRPRKNSARTGAANVDSIKPVEMHPAPRRRSGQIENEVVKVLAEHPDDLRTVEVHRKVEVRLRRKIRHTTVTRILCMDVGPGGKFERIARGHYRLGDVSTDASNSEPRSGSILGAIVSVLRWHPEGYRTFEIHRMVEDQLGRQVAQSTVTTTLSLGTSPDGWFERIARGRYRLRPGADTPRP